MDIDVLKLLLKFIPKAIKAAYYSDLGLPRNADYDFNQPYYMPGSIDAICFSSISFGAVR